MKASGVWKAQWRAIRKLWRDPGIRIQFERVRICQACGVAYVPVRLRKNGRYCSAECGRAALRAIRKLSRGSRVCQQCGVTYVPVRFKKNGKYCGPKCKERARDLRRQARHGLLLTYRCENCGELKVAHPSTPRQKYCGDCRPAVQAKRSANTFRRLQAQMTMERCGYPSCSNFLNAVQATSGTVYCSRRCRTEFQRSEPAQFWASQILRTSMKLQRLLEIEEQRHAA